MYFLYLRQQFNLVIVKYIIQNNLGFYLALVESFPSLNKSVAYWNEGRSECNWFNLSKKKKKV